MARLHELARQVGETPKSEASKIEAQFTASAQLLGLLEDNAEMGYWAVENAHDDLIEQANELVRHLIKDRNTARAEKNWARADALRDGFADAGLTIRDTSDGSQWSFEGPVDIAKLEALK
jgi:cysteinyl-tRNA synthetase